MQRNKYKDLIIEIDINSERTKEDWKMWLIKFNKSLSNKLSCANNEHDKNIIGDIFSYLKVQNDLKFTSIWKIKTINNLINKKFEIRDKFI